MKISQKFPLVRNYEGCWPVTDLIRLELKYTSGRARLDEQKRSAKAGKRLMKEAKGKGREQAN